MELTDEQWQVLEPLIGELPRRPHGLVDELHLMIGNAILREGVPAFEGKLDVSLRLIDIRTWEESDNVLLWYKVTAKGT
jgi:dihydrofolate reductase